MGVNSLWDIVGPAARPVKLEALSRKKLAVDASIWIYQFLKAVRDKEGNSLGQTHIVGFFRRICKLLYFGILPLFVFDGDAPPLKRQTIQKRRERRQGNSDNVATTAQKLLAIQAQRQAQDAVKASRMNKADKSSANEDDVYLEDLPILHPEHGRSTSKSPEPILIESSPVRKFVKRDEYHLPELKQFTVLKSDTRIMPASEFQEYADDASFDVVDGIDINSVDPKSAEFEALPLATQYMILSHLRLRSRLRLGYSKDQLEELFPNSRDFSKFQIQQVQKRNFYTQRLMNVSGMGEESGNATRRIAGDKDKHYALVNTGDGWTLSLGGDDSNEPIELDEFGDAKVKTIVTDERTKHLHEVSESESDDLEDVPLEENDDQAELDKAIVESIYEKFQGDYEIEKPLDEFDLDELKLATEMSRAEYSKSRNEEEKLQKQFANSVAKFGHFDFGQSLLFGSETPQEEPIVTEKIVNADKTTTNPETLRIEEIEILSDEEEPQLAKESTPPPKEMPSWFADNGVLLHNPHSQKEFYDEDSVAKKPVNENQQAGIISWSEALEIIDEQPRIQDEDVEIHEVEESDKDDSDVEVIEEVLVPVPESQDSKKEGMGEAILQGPTNTVAVPDYAKSRPKSSSSQQTSRTQQNSSSQQTSSNEQTSSNVQISGIQKSISEISESRSSSSEKKSKGPAVIDYDFEEQDEEQLVRQLRDEEQQHAEFTAQIGALQKVTFGTSVTDEQLLQEKLQKAKRDSDEVSETMISDVQELLKRFGIPYITAPMEAEAQCAELYRMGLVDGIVTDDSDCFLFGGSRIYKNMFNQKQYVECYIAEDIENTIGLDNDKLIELALLLGSDYTEGIKGIGPVLAMEILAEFGNLENLKTWFDEHTQMKQNITNKPSPLEKSLLTKVKNGKLFLPDGFPDHVVKDAYKHPEVDRDDSEFKWGIPSLDQIRTFLMYNIGWSQSKVDEVMIPLIRDMNKKRAEGTQSTIGEFFPQEYISYKKEVNLGKRMKIAANKLKK